jgi:multiple sugar transport system substrate-binding protein
MVNRQLTRRGMLTLFGSLGLTAIAAACAPATPTSTPVPAKPAAEPTKPAAAAPAAPAAAPTNTPAPAAAAPAPAKPTEAPKPAAEPTKPAVQAAAPAAAPSGAPVPISIATSWTGTGEKKVWDQLIAQFNKKYPNIKITLDLSSAEGEYDQKLFAQLAAGTLPDVVLTSDNHVVPFKQNKVTRDMIPFAQKTNFPYQDFDKSFLDLGMVEGELHMLPRGGDVVVLFINKKMVKDAGVEIPWKLDATGNTWTKEDFAKVTQRLTVDTKGKRGDEAGFDKANVSVYGAAVGNTWWAVYVPAVLSEGGQFVAPDLSKSLLNSPESVKAFDWLTKGVRDGFWAPTSFLNTVGGTGGAWAGGKAAIMMTVRAAIPGFRDKITDDWDVAHFPKGSAKRVTGMGTFGFALSGSSKVPDQAWQYLDWMYGEEGMQILAQSYGSVPAQKRFYKSAFWRELPAPPANNDIFTDAFAYGTLPPRLPFYTTGPFSKAITDGMVEMELGKKSAAEVVKEVDAELTKWLTTNPPKKA